MSDHSCPRNPEYDVVYDTTKALFETYRSKSSEAAHDWITLPNDERRAWEAVAQLSLGFVRTAEERHETLERTRKELGLARLQVERLETSLRITEAARLLASSLLAGAGDRIAELERELDAADEAISP